MPSPLKKRQILQNKARSKGKAAASKRISDKIKHLIDSGEVPNTPEGRKKAAGMAYGMERSGRLRSGGKYTPVKKKG
jgi:hypothetical protein